MQLALAPTLAPDTRSTLRRNSAAILRLFFAFAASLEPPAAPKCTEKNEKSRFFNP